MLFENLEEFSADDAAFIAECVVHPDPFATGVNPAAALQVGEVARHRGLGQLQNRHQVADAQFSFGLQKQDDAQADRV